MTKKVYRSKKISILLILIVLINSFTSGLLPVASAVTNTEPVAENLYFTEKDQKEKIQELKVEQDFSIDLVLQDGQDTEAVIQLPEGISLNDESLAQEGLTYEKDTRTVNVDWSKITALEQMKRVSLSFTNSLKENVSIQAETERDGQTYYSQALNIIPVSPETASTTERTTERTDSEESAAKDAKTDESNNTDSDSSKKATLQAAAGDLDFNETDSYAVSLDGKTLYQLDGSNPTTIKASVQISGDFSTSANGTALDKNQGFIYVSDQNNRNLYKIAPDGTSSLVTTLSGRNIDNATISGENYYYITLIDGVANLGSYNLTTGENQLREISNSAGYSISGGDIIVDADGLIWYASNSNIVQIDPKTSTLLREIPIEPTDGIAITPFVRGLSFLPDGQMLISAGSNDTVTLFTLNPETLSTKYIGSIQGVEYFSADLASGVEPVFAPNPPVLESKKTASIQTKADGNTDTKNPEVGDTLLYTIETRNTVENSLVQNLTISDKIPEGLTYVSGSLTVDGQAVTDAEGDDKGHIVNGNVAGQFGDVTDTEWHTLTFQVTVNEDQAGQKIPNTAVVKGDNITTPSEPNTEVTINPKEEIDACARPVALINGDFEKPEGPGTYDNSVAGGGYYYADTVPGWETTDVARTPRGIIQIMDPDRPSTIPSNTPNKDNLTSRFGELNADTNSMLYQELPTTPGQTIYWRLNHRGWNGVDTMSVNIGPVTADPFNTTPEIERISTGTTWKTYSGVYKVPAGQTTTRFGFKAISTSNGALAFGNYLDDVFLGTEPCVVAEKTVSPKEDVFAGEELTYEVNVKNTGGDIAADAVFEDAIPEGTEYVPGSLKITNGPGKGDLTDEKDDDAGQIDGEKVIVKLGNLPNTTDLPEGITVQFKVKALSTETEKVVVNKAIINYDNLLINESQSTETNEVKTTVLPKPEIDACARPVALINGSFEEGPARGSYQSSGIFFYEDEVPGWQTTDDAQGVKIIEIWNHKEDLPATAKNFAAPVDGDRWAELNAFENGMLYQDVETTPGQTLYWRLSHMGRQGVDTMQVRIGQATSNPYDTVPQTQMSTGNTAWKTYTGTYTVPAGQTTTRFGFEAVKTANGNLGAGNFLDDIFLGTEPCVVAEKTVSPEGEVNAGDELTYEVNVKNNGGDIAADALFEDAIPEGTEYVPGSLKIKNGTGTIDLTDADDNDAGHFDGQKVIVKLGDLPNTNNLPNGMTVQFKVKALVSDTITQVKNKAKIDYKNLLTNEDEVVDSNEVTTPLTYKKPVFESKKSAAIKEKADGNTDTEHPEVGDTLTYTIQTQNTIKDSLVKNMTIKDKLPEGLEYVPGTLKVDGVAVSDDEDDDAGHYVDGTFTGQFGDIQDTDVHKIEFEVKVLAGQAGKDIKNIATVSGDNIDEPNRPENEVKVYPRLPVLESEKTAANLEEGKEIFEVGDTVVYTIKTRNTVSDGVVTDLKISDTIPAGLTYVEGSLKIDGKSATDTVGDDNGHVDNKEVQGTFGDVTDTEWHTVEFQAKINSGQAEQAINNIATVEGGNIDKPDKPEETVNVTPKKPNLVSEKTYTIQEKAAENTDAEHPEVGDTLLYTIKTQNTVEDSLVENMLIKDKLPEGLEYVPGTLKVDGVAVSDDEDDDAGHYVDGTFTGQFGDVRDTAEHKIEFEVKVLAGQAGKDIKNIATVSGDNTDEPNRPENEVKVYPRLPVLESEKTAVNLEEGKEIFEVGDTVVYTIKTRNTVSDGVVTDLKISDTIPAGLTYVEGTLKIDGKAATDTVGDDNGHVDNKEVQGTFGDVTDTEWHTVEFQAKINSGQAEQAINNIATVEGGNIDKPDKPEETVNVTPKKPNLVSEKTYTIQEKAAENTDAEHPEVGDTLLYTIKTQNTVEDSLVENMLIEDKLPEGLEYVPGTLKVDGVAVSDDEDDDAGHYVDGTFTGQFGDVRDTAEHKIEFEVKVLPGQAGKDIKNIATVSGDNTDEPNRPENEVKVYPRLPVLESEKSAANVEEGKNTYEVGDTIEYTIKTRNTVSEGVVKNLVISDTIPEGLEYVPGTLKVDGTVVTDNQDGDNGHSVDGKVAGQFGDVTDTEWHTVTFHAKVKQGQAGKVIENKAAVDGDNIDKPDEPTKEVEINTSDMKLSKVADKKVVHVGDIVTYTIEAENAETGAVWNGTIKDKLPANVELVSGSTELDGKALADKDVWNEGQLTVTPVTVKAGDKATITFQVKVLESALNTTVENIATGDDPDQPNDPIETPPTETEVVPSAGKLSSKKAVFNADGEAIDGQKVKVGDQLTYKITAENIKEATTIINNVKVIDDIPEGLSYVPGTLTVNGEAKDDSAVNGQVVTVDDIGSLKGGEKVEVAFTVTVTEDAKGEITNVATVEGSVPGEKPGDPDDPTDPEKPGTDVKVPADMKLSKVADKKVVHVGDIVTYTIEAKNGEAGGIWNGTIEDKVPANVELVSGSTTLNGKALADKDVWNKGQLTVSPVTVKAGETATVTFQVKVLEGALNSTVENIATAYDPDQPLDPDEPGKDPEDPIKTPPTETEVVSSAGKLSSKKAVFNADGEAIDGQKVKVGDQLTYKITAENIKEATTIVNNVKVTDDIPEGLSYVPGTLTVNGEAKDDSAVNGQVVKVDNIGSLKGGEKVEVAFTVTVTEDAKGEITNVATVEGSVPGEKPGDPDDPTDPEKPGTDVKVPADMKLSKVADKKVVHVGDIVTYTIEAKNGEAGGVWNGTIKDPLPANVELVSGSTTLNGKALADKDVWSKGQLTVSPVTVKAGETATVTFQVKVLEGALNSTVENIATGYDPDQPLDPDEPGKDPEDPIKTPPTETEVVSSAGKLSSKKAVFNADGEAIDGQKVKVGDQLTYKITAENIKEATTIVNNVKVTDNIPEGLSYVPGTLTVNGEAKDDSAVNGQVVTVDNIGSLKGGEKVEVAFTVTVTEDAKGEITNVATVEGSVPGENPEDPDQPTDPEKPGTDVKVPADISLTKVADKKTVHVGDTVTYTIEAKNGKAGGVWNGTIKDPLPANVELVSGSTKLNGKALADKEVWSKGQLTVSPVTVKAGETATVTFQVKVLEGALNSTVENIATAYDPDQPLDPDEPGKDPEDPIKTPPTETEVVSSAGKLSSKKAVFNANGDAIDGQKVKVGDQLTYKITAENIKEATTIVKNVKVIDNIPEGLSYVPGTLTVNGEAKDDSAVNGQVVKVDNIGSLKGGEKVEVAFTVTVTEDAKGEITNVATVEGSVPGENPEDPDQPTDPEKPGTDVKVPADITLTKVANKKTVHVGDIVTYTIEAKNGKAGGVWNGTIKDPLPANVELVSGSTELNGKALADKDVWSKGQLTVSPVTVKAGETATVTFQVKVLEGALNSTVENIAIAYDPDQPLDPDEPGKDPENPIKTPPTTTKVVPDNGDESPSDEEDNDDDNKDPVKPDKDRPSDQDKLPQTGEAQSSYMLIGSLMIGIAIVGLFVRRRMITK